MANNQDTYLFRDNMYDDIEKSLNSNANMFISYIKRFLDKNSDVLSDSGLSKKLYFTDADRSEIFRRTKANPNEVSKLIKETKLVDPEWKILNRPENWVMILAIKYFKEHRKNEELHLILMFHTCYLYASAHHKYFKYPPNENIMDYTINHLSNKYDIKRLGNLQKALFKLTMNYYETYIDYYEDFNDLNIKNLSTNLWTRVNNFTKNIAEEYYKNAEKGNYLNKETDSTDEDNYYEVDNISGVIERLSNKTTNYVISNGIDRKISDMSSRMCNVSQNITRSTIESIINNENQDITDLVTIILQQFLINDKKTPNEINSRYFITFANKLYTRSNTTDKGILRMKEILNEWLIKYSEKYNQTERENTKSNFRKAIYLYFIFIIQQVNVNR